MLKEVILSIKLVMLIMITLQHSNTATQPHSNAAKQQESKTPKTLHLNRGQRKPRKLARAAGPPNPSRTLPGQIKPPLVPV